VAQAIVHLASNGELAVSNAVTAHNTNIKRKDVEEVFKTIDIPPCPAIVTQVMAEVQREEPNLTWLAKAISADPSMVAIALKLANSPLFRTGTPITDVRRALDRLGLRNIACVIIASSLRATMTGVPSAFIEKFWARTSSLAVLAGQVARRQYAVSPDAAFTYALFHNAGIPLMVRRFPNYLEIIESCRTSGRLLVEAEDELLPCSHPVVGALLVRNWGLPPMVSQAVRCHHEPDLYDLPDKTLPDGALSLIAVTQIAERLASDLEQEDDLEVGDDLFARAVSHFGIDDEEMDALRDAAQGARAGS
jgi:HD-like signal output (HDOD) protein